MATPATAEAGAVDLELRLLIKLSDGGLLGGTTVEGVLDTGRYEEDGVTGAFLVVVALVNIELEGRLPGTDSEDDAAALATTKAVNEVVKHGGNASIIGKVLEVLEVVKQGVVRELTDAVMGLKGSDSGEMTLHDTLSVEATSKKQKRKCRSAAERGALGGSVTLRQMPAQEAMTSTPLRDTEREEASPHDGSEASLCPKLLHDLDEGACAALKQTSGNGLEPERGALKAAVVKEAESERHTPKVGARRSMEMRKRTGDNMIARRGEANVGRQVGDFPADNPSS